MIHFKMSCDAIPHPSGHFPRCELLARFTALYKGLKGLIERIERGQDKPASPEDGIFIDLTWIESEADENKRSWVMRTWVPIPTDLILVRETRMFRVVVSIWMLGCGDKKPRRLKGEREMSVTHLKMSDLV